MSFDSSSRRTVLKGIGGIGAMTVVGTGTAFADEHEGEAGLRVAHASPDAPNVDVFVNDTEVLSDVPFRTVSGYLEISAGEYDIRIEDAANTVTVFDETVDLAAEDYTAVALGELSEGTFMVKIFEDTNGANIGDDQARVRAIHASPDAPAVDVTVSGGGLLFDGVAFGESSGYAVVPAGEYDVEIRPDTADNDGPVVFEAEGVELAGRSTYTVFALGYLSPDDEPTDEEFGLEPKLDKGAPPRGDDDDEEEEDDDEEGEDRGRGRGKDDEERGRGRGRDD